MDDSIGPREFTTTHWSLVVAANSDAASQTAARQAFEDLCRSYWYPLYTFVRRRGYASSDAQDLTQTFFAGIIAGDGFSKADPQKGRFRSYLLGALKHFLANEWHRSQAQKRGGGQVFLELDALDAETRYALEPAQLADPDTSFDSVWAQQMIARSLEKLRATFAARGQAELFDTLKGSLTGDQPPRREIAERLGMTEGAVKVAIHRLRQRFRETVRAEIAETVADPAEVDDEMLYLLAVLRKDLGKSL